MTAFAVRFGLARGLGMGVMARAAGSSLVIAPCLLTVAILAALRLLTIVGLMAGGAGLVLGRRVFLLLMTVGADRDITRGVMW